VRVWFPVLCRCPLHSRTVVPALGTSVAADSRRVASGSKRSGLRIRPKPDIHVNDHGFVELSNGGVPAPLGSGNPALYTPTAGNLTIGAPKVAPLYSDMTLVGGGECFLRSTSTQCTVTWHTAQSYGIPSPRFSFQLVLEPNGIIRFVYCPGCTNNSTFGGVSSNGITGVSPAGGVAAPAGVDLSSDGVSSSPTTYELFPVANGFDLADRTIVLTPTATGYRYAAALSSDCVTATRYGTGCDGLGLGAIGLPTLGHAGFKLRAENVPAASPLGPLLGMTGCEGYTNASIGVFTGSAVSSGPTGLGNVSTFDLPIPSTLSLVGATLAAQALSFSLSNTALLASSNGLELHVGVSGPAGPPAPRLNMVAIAPGTFAMGSMAGTAAEQPVRQVTISRPFRMGKYEVTQAQYQAVVGNNPSAFQGPNAPDAAQRPATSTACRPKRSGSTAAAPARPRNGTRGRAWARARRTSTARWRTPRIPSVRRRWSAATRRTPSGCAACTATWRSGASTPTRPMRRALSPIRSSPAARPAWSAAGRTAATAWRSVADRPSATSQRPSAPAGTSASASCSPPRSCHSGTQRRPCACRPANRGGVPPPGPGAWPAVPPRRHQPQGGARIAASPYLIACYSSCEVSGGAAGRLGSGAVVCGSARAAASHLVRCRAVGPVDSPQPCNPSP
jgi:formylglycine-generating enzyme required for sulfatase activity